jgi:Fur family transcriptional regulator, ferric uptake regulator
MKTSSVDQIIIDFLSLKQHHFTSQQVFDQIKTRLPAVNRSTIYRSLERLVNQGKISVSDIGTGSLVYELVENTTHHHLVCQQCHQIITIPPEEVTKLFNTIEQNSHFQIITNHLILYGICSFCQSSDQE